MIVQRAFVGMILALSGIHAQPLGTNTYMPILSPIPSRTTVPSLSPNSSFLSCYVTSGPGTAGNSIQRSKGPIPNANVCVRYYTFNVTRVDSYNGVSNQTFGNIPQQPYVQDVYGCYTDFCNIPYSPSAIQSATTSLSQRLTLSQSSTVSITTSTGRVQPTVVLSTTSTGGVSPTSVASTTSTGRVSPTVVLSTTSTGLVSPTSVASTTSTGLVSPTVVLSTTSTGGVSPTIVLSTTSTGGVSPTSVASTTSTGLVSPTSGVSTTSTGLVSPTVVLSTTSTGRVSPTTSTGRVSPTVVLSTTSTGLVSPTSGVSTTSTGLVSPTSVASTTSTVLASSTSISSSSLTTRTSISPTGLSSPASVSSTGILSPTALLSSAPTTLGSPTFQSISPVPWPVSTKAIPQPVNQTYANVYEVVVRVHGLSDTQIADTMSYANVRMQLLCSIHTVSNVRITQIHPYGSSIQPYNVPIQDPVNRVPYTCTMSGTRRLRNLQTVFDVDVFLEVNSSNVPLAPQSVVAPSNAQPASENYAILGASVCILCIAVGVLLYRRRLRNTRRMRVLSILSPLQEKGYEPNPPQRSKETRHEFPPNQVRK